MNQTIQMLEGILGQEVVLYTNVLALFEKKKEVLIKGDNDAFETLVKEEARALSNIRKSETAREQTIEEIANELALSPDGLTLKTLAEKIGGAQGLSMLKLRGQLRKLIAKVSDVNKQNKALIETHQKYAAFCLGLVTGELNSTNIYTSTGEVGAEKASKHILFDGQA